MCWLQEVPCSDKRTAKQRFRPFAAVYKTDKYIGWASLVCLSHRSRIWRIHWLHEQGSHVTFFCPFSVANTLRHTIRDDMRMMGRVEWNMKFYTFKAAKVFGKGSPSYFKTNIPIKAEHSSYGMPLSAINL